MPVYRQVNIPSGPGGGLWHGSATPGPGASPDAGRGPTAPRRRVGVTNIGRRAVALTVIGATALGLGSATALGASKPAQGGTVLFGQEFPPDCLNIALTDCISSY